MNKKFYYLFLLLLFAISIFISLITKAQENENSSKRFILIITQVLSDSPAEKAGLRVNDIIYSFDGKIFYESAKTTIAKDFIDFIRTLPKGTYNIIVLRKGEKFNTHINFPDLSSSPRLGVVIETLENNPQIYFDNALSTIRVASSRDDLKKVATLFEKAKALSPEWADVYYNLGLIYEKLDYYDKAVENLTEFLRFALRRHSSGVEDIAIQIGKNKKKHENLESIKTKMVNGNLILIKKFPPSKIAPPVSSPKFKLDNSGKIWIINPLKESIVQDKTFRGCQERILRKYPLILVLFDGRYFEVRFAAVWPTDRNNPLFYPSYYLLKGEINLNSPDPAIIIKEYVYNHFDATSSDFEKTLEYAFKESQKFIFNEQRDFRSELHFRFE